MTDMSAGPLLIADGVVVDGLRESDAAAIFEAQDDEIRLRFGTGSPSTLSQALEWTVNAIEERDEFRAWAIREREGGPLLGKVTLRCTEFGPPDARQRGAYIEFWVAAAARGRGLAVKALRAVLEWAFDELGRDWINAQVECDNNPSQRLLSRLGFRVVDETTFHERPAVIVRLHRSK